MNKKYPKHTKNIVINGFIALKTPKKTWKGLKMTYVWKK
jgi:hypothetical protein